MEVARLGGNSTGMEDFLAGRPAERATPDRQRGSQGTWKMLAGYFQDDWRIRPRLILNLGLRYEYHSPMDESNGQFGSFSPTTGMVQQGQGGLGTLWKPDRTNFSPRVGFAWDVKGDGKTVVRGGASVIYSSFVLFTFLAEFDFQNDTATSLASVPTGALLQVNGVSTPGPGNITLGVATIPGCCPQLERRRVSAPCREMRRWHWRRRKPVRHHGRGPESEEPLCCEFQFGRAARLQQ